MMANFTEGSAIGFRLRKSIKIAPGVKITLSAGGVSTLVGS
jgi:hypothetical protein